ncbi:hypothetical protein AGOR_G00006310 [Albula goreensis]|uniref:Perilipin-1 n=1 Tax=Albula goreensis TaxID=1534307 RepID=A0A8T3E5G0_9TELE|nr:hypothetical protein AGOR_G00006310 [Albula goreensis]
MFVFCLDQQTDCRLNAISTFLRLRQTFPVNSRLSVNITTMAPEKTAPPNVQGGNPQQDSAFLRLLNLPVISSTREMIERTYSSTKHTHPIICSVCGVYERGAKTAGSLAVWSMQPAINRLEPQIEAVNSLACKGLDRLEEKIPALQYPPEKLATDIAEAVASTVQTAKQGISNTITSTSDKALSLATGSYELTRGVHLVNYILPASDEEIEQDRSWDQDAGAQAPQPGYRRLGTLGSTVCWRAYKQTTTQLQHAGSQSKQLVMSIPGVTPLVGVATRNMETAVGVVLGLQSSVGGLFGGVDEQMDKERRKKKEGELLQTGGVRGLVSGLGQQLQGAYVSVVSGVKNAPAATLSLARDGTGALLGTLGNATQHMLEAAAHYGLLPGKSPESGANTSCTPIKEEDEEEKRARPPPWTPGRGIQVAPDFRGSPGVAEEGSGTDPNPAENPAGQPWAELLRPERGGRHEVPHFRLYSYKAQQPG